MQDAADSLLRAQQRFKQVLGERPQLQLRFESDPSLQNELSSLWQASDYALDLCVTQPAMLEDLLASGDVAREYSDWSQHLLDFCRQQSVVDTALMELATLQQLLRRFRQREWLRIVWRDVCGHATLEQTCSDLTALADCCIRFALPLLQQQVITQHGYARDSQGNAQELMVLAMGKYGAGELNLSSDIDLIYAFAEDGETVVDDNLRARYPAAQSCTVQYFFTRVGQLLVAALDTFTADGFVFRVDLRLRPYGNAGAVALSLAALDEYYLTQGRDWERFAMIKVRAVTGAEHNVASLMQMLRNFTYRRYLDFATIEALRDLKRQIEQQVRRKSLQHNIKLGAGGIREIEFIVQVFQLIHGGKRKTLQLSSLQQSLIALVEAGLLKPEEAEALRSSYRFLRRLEHAIQMLRDQQTHEYPQEALAEHRVALTLGFGDALALRQATAAVRAKVQQQFHDVIHALKEEQQGKINPSLQQVWLAQVDDERALALLHEQGYHEAEEIKRSLETFKNSRQVLGLDRVSRERLDHFMPLLLTAATTFAHSSQAFLRSFRFVQAVVQRTVYLVLLLENPLALQQLLSLCAASPWVVELLARYPVLLDELLRPLRQPPGLEELRSLLQRQLLRSLPQDIEGQLDIIVYFKQEQVLNVAAAELAGTMPLMKVSDYLSWIAETVVGYLLQLAWQQLTARHGFPANSKGHYGACDFIIIAYGKLGGLELNYGSDLDMVFVHDGHQELETSGGSGAPLNSTAFYAQLAQKILAYLGTQTLVGKLYEVDLRLRPSGASGALVSSLTAFKRYQGQEAWTWEHQALVRARVIAGDTALAENFNQVRSEVLGRKREAAALRADVLQMRERMLRQHGSRNVQRFDLKQDLGGLIDIEFMVQYLVLAHANQHVELLHYPDNMRLLDVAAKCGVLSTESAAFLQDCYLVYRGELHKNALNLQESVLEASVFAEQRDRVRQLWQQVFGQQAGDTGVQR